jgi:hypothetical protein
VSASGTWSSGDSPDECPAALTRTRYSAFGTPAKKYHPSLGAEAVMRTSPPAGDAASAPLAIRLATAPPNPLPEPSITLP